jgi:hypothetical protein
LGFVWPKSTTNPMTPLVGFEDGFDLASMCRELHSLVERPAAGGTVIM